MFDAKGLVPIPVPVLNAPPNWPSPVAFVANEGTVLDDGNPVDPNGPLERLDALVPANIVARNGFAPPAVPVA